MSAPPTSGKDEMREQLLHLLLGSDTTSEESYVDTKAKFLIDDLVPFIAQSNQRAVRATLEGLAFYGRWGRVDELPAEIKRRLAATQPQKDERGAESPKIVDGGRINLLPLDPEDRL